MPRSRATRAGDYRSRANAGSIGGAAWHGLQARDLVSFGRGGPVPKSRSARGTYPGSERATCMPRSGGDAQGVVAGRHFRRRVRGRRRRHAARGHYGGPAGRRDHAAARAGRRARKEMAKDLPAHGARGASCNGHGAIVKRGLGIFVFGSGKRFPTPFSYAISRTAARDAASGSRDAPRTGAREGGTQVVSRPPQGRGQSRFAPRTPQNWDSPLWSRSGRDQPAAPSYTGPGT
jgi:hypothetical protein